jgi:1-acyl-sn-glycerol-3-phosphate acyltransferase
MGFELMLGLLHRVYTWLLFVPFLGVLTALMGACVLITSSFAPRFSNRIWPLIWSRLNFLLTPARVTVTGLENINPGKSYIIASNHISQYDIFVLYGWLPVDLKWVIKKELRKVPVIGIACAALGHIFLDRRNKASAINSLQAAKDSLRPGSSVLFFPEGTRSKNGELLPFKKGAFMLARDIDIPVLPVTVRGTEKILPPGSLKLRPGRAEMIIHPEIAVETVRSMSAEDLALHTRDIIAASNSAADEALLYDQKIPS